MRVEELRGLTGLSRKAFSEKYGIPLRTVENWEYGKNTPPEYVMKLLERVIREDYKVEGEEIVKKYYILDETNGDEFVSEPYEKKRMQSRMLMQSGTI